MYVNFKAIRIQNQYKVVFVQTIFAISLCEFIRFPMDVGVTLPGPYECWGGGGEISMVLPLKDPLRLFKRNMILNQVETFCLSTLYDLSGGARVSMHTK